MEMVLLKVGSNGPEVVAFQQWFQRYAASYAPPVDGWYGYPDENAVRILQARLKLPVTGIFDDATAQAAEYKPKPTAPPVKRALGVVFRGTGGIIGQDPVSWVLQPIAHLVEERNPDFPATMGGIPVGSAGGIQDPSAQKAISIGFENGKREIDLALAIDSTRKVVIGGYSLGAIVAALLREWMLSKYPDNYCCSYSFGDPSRPYGGAYYGGPVPSGRGIASYRFGNVKDYRHCWLTQELDMYGNIPLGATGEIMTDAYDLVTNTEISDPLGTLMKILPHIMEIVKDALGGTEGSPLNPFGSTIPTDPVSLLGVVLPLFLGMLPGLIAAAGGNTAKLIGPAAALQAAIIALKFLAAGTGPHIRYHIDEVWPGQTYVGLGTQHVRDWVTRV